MQTIRFPRAFRHDHPPIQDVNRIIAERRTPGQRLADRVARTMGSWAFITIQSTLLACWVVLNVVAVARHWDPYPFILMNLMLSLQAAYAAPIIMMSQNRQAERDRLEAHNDFVVDQKAEEEIRAVLDHLHAQDEALARILELLDTRHGAASSQPAIE